MLFLSLYVIALGCVLIVVGSILDSEYIAVPGFFTAAVGILSLMLL